MLAGEGARVFFLSIGSATTRGAVLSALGRALGLASRTSNEMALFESIVEHLEVSPSIVFFDAVDNVRGPIRTVVEDLLAETTDAMFVVCARTALGSSLEVVSTLGPLIPEVARTLLLDRVKQASRERSVPLDLASRLAERAGGLPLAIEIVAGWVAAIGAQEALTALSEGELALDALDHALDASWTLLGAAERLSFAALGVFRGAFVLEAARAVAGTDRASAHLAALVSASLVHATETPDGSAYELLEGIRAYALKQAVREGIAEAAQERLSTYLAESERPRADLRSSWGRLVRERDDVLAAWDRAIDTDAARALRLAVVIEPNLSAQGPLGLHRSVLERSIAASRSAGLSRVSKAGAGATVDMFYSLGRLEASRGHHRASIRVLDEGVALSEETSDDVRTAWLLAEVSHSLRVLGKTTDARKKVSRAQALALAQTNDRLQSTVERAHAALLVVEGRAEEADAAYRRAAASARAAKALRLEGTALFGSARLHLACGRLDDAAHDLSEAKERFQFISDALRLARLSVYEGLIALKRGLANEADARLTRALFDVVLHDDIEGELEARFGLVQVAAAGDDLRLAARRLDEIDVLLGRTDDPTWVTRRDRARVALSGETEQHGITLTLPRDGRTFELQTRVVDFGRRGPLRRILVALAENVHAPKRRALSVSDLLAAGWPDEKMLHEAGTARVYMAIRRLRTLGLEPILRTSDEGYAFDESVRVVWLP